MFKLFTSGYFLTKWYIFSFKDEENLNGKWQHILFQISSQWGKNVWMYNVNALHGQTWPYSLSQRLRIDNALSNPFGEF